ncbi:rRNA-processing protein UTP23 homolog [Ipomoea triloba]|uniref:rRNA-processing protein UTP23 homolog n=1 Tax=Ipomoea triloba TaxID=35885 RepID=UPI00125DE25D|nr:rRNA-processing protein UTP23 homolog [Ipomoea triloba]XP_031126322.1 rRNA-processing protein UTP23 homolog [Ipomoea triloba]
MPNMNDNSEEKPFFNDWLYAESRSQNRISRQALQFYQTNYGFKQPLNVMCSSRFLQKWRSAGEIEQRLSSVLAEKAVIWASNCIVQELGGGGYDGLKVYSCDHQSSMSGKSCISQIAKQQSSKLVFATDNLYFSKKLLKLAGVPVLLLKNTVLMLMKPSRAQRQFAKAEAEAQKAEAEEFAKQRKRKAGKAEAEEFGKQRKRKAGKAEAEEFAKQRKRKSH